MTFGWVYKLSCFVLCSFLVGCGKQTPQAIQPKQLQAQLGQAKHFDIPIPLTFSLADSSSKQQQSIYSDYMRYNGSLSVAQTSAFFKKEMELAGWDIVDLSNSTECHGYFVAGASAA